MANLDKFYCTGDMNKLRMIVMIYFRTKTFFSLTVFVHIKMSYYWFNRKELLQTEIASNLVDTDKIVVSDKLNGKFRQILLHWGYE